MELPEARVCNRGFQSWQNMKITRGTLKSFDAQALSLDHKSESLGGGPRHQYFLKFSMCFQCAARFAKTRLKTLRINSNYRKIKRLRDQVGF